MGKQSSVMLLLTAKDIMKDIIKEVTHVMSSSQSEIPCPFRVPATEMSPTAAREGPCKRRARGAQAVSLPLVRDLFTQPYRAESPHLF